MGRSKESGILSVDGSNRFRFETNSHSIETLVVSQQKCFYNQTYREVDFDTFISADFHCSASRAHESNENTREKLRGFKIRRTFPE